MTTPSSVREKAGRVNSVRYDNQKIKSNLVSTITNLRSYWSSESANMFYDECEEAYLAFDDSINKQESIKEKLNTLASEVMRAEAERAAKREAERKASELLLQMNKKPNYVKTNL